MRKLYKRKKESNGNGKSGGSPRFSAVGQSFNPGHNLIGKDDMDSVVLLRAPGSVWPEAAMNRQTDSRRLNGNRRAVYR